MFLEFYQLREQPFGVTPDPRYLYFSPGHREALASLFYGIETGRGFLSLIAEPGMGKTTLLFQLLERLKDSVRSVFLFQTQCDSRELLRYILEGLGLDACDGDLVRMHARLNEFLFREALARRKVVLVIDEAQNLSDSVLETVRLLSDFEAPDRKLLQIVLAGQPELAHRLLRPCLSQLRQRIAVLTHLDPLPSVETARYISHRLQVAGYDGPELFTPAALALIAERSHGVPRNINNICFSALSLGCAAECKKIGHEIVQEAIADLSLDSYVQQTETSKNISPNPPFVPALPASSVPQALRQSFTLPSKIDWRTWGLTRPAILAAAFGALLLYFGARDNGATTPPAPVANAEAASVSGAVGMQSSPAQFSPAGTLPGSRVQNDRGEGLSNTFTYVVRPKDTLRQLCERFVGRYDSAVLAQIRQLNQDLKHPDHIEVGQQLRLPRYPLH